MPWTAQWKVVGNVPTDEVTGSSVGAATWPWSHPWARRASLVTAEGRQVVGMSPPRRPGRGWKASGDLCCRRGHGKAAENATSMEFAARTAMGAGARGRSRDDWEREAAAPAPPPRFTADAAAQRRRTWPLDSSDKRGDGVAGRSPLLHVVARRLVWPGGKSWPPAARCGQAACRGRGRAAHRGGPVTEAGRLVIAG